MKIINVTPHELNLIDKQGAIITIAPSGTVARLQESRVQLENVAGFPVSAIQFEAIENLPEPVEGVIYVTSALVAMQARRADVYSPGVPVRDAEGRVIGAQGLTAQKR